MKFTSTVEIPLAEIKLELRLEEVTGSDIRFSGSELADHCESASNELQALIGAVSRFCTSRAQSDAHQNAYISDWGPAADYMLLVTCEVFTPVECTQAELERVLRGQQQLIYTHFDSLIRGHISRRGRRSAHGVGRMAMGPVCD